MAGDTVPLRRLIDENGAVVPLTGASFSAASNLAQPGNLTVGVAEVEIAIAGTTKTILFRADPTNTGRIYIGLTGVQSDGTVHARYLDPGESWDFDYNDSTNPLFAISDTAAQTLSVGALL